MIESLVDVPGQIVFLGDYIDRLPSMQLMNRLLKLEKERPDYIMLPGNHEWMCLEWYLENQLKIKSGHLQEIPTPGGTLMKEWKEMGEVPEAHIRFFERILRKRYHLSPNGNLLFVHAGVEKSLKQLPLESMNPDHFLWSRRMPSDYYGPLLIHGHTFAGALPSQKDREINLETRCWIDPSRPLSVGVFRDVREQTQQCIGVVQFRG